MVDNSKPRESEKVELDDREDRSRASMSAILALEAARKLKQTENAAVIVEEEAEDQLET